MGLDDNYIIIGQSSTTSNLQITTAVDPKTNRYNGTGSIPYNANISFWHELGHEITQNKDLGSTIDFENQVRLIYKVKNSAGTFSQQPLTPLRPKDLEHSNLNITIRQ